MNAHIKALLIVIVFILIGVAGYFLFLKTSYHEVQTANTITRAESIVLPTKDFKLIDGKLFSIQIFKNKIVIMNFWASWCAPCVEEVPSLVELTKKNKDIVVLAISGDTKLDELLAFMKSFPDFNKAPFYQVWDNNSAFLKDFNIIKLPESYIFNRKGQMVKRISGTLNWNTPDSLEYFKSLE